MANKAGDTYYTQTSLHIDNKPTLHEQTSLCIFISQYYIHVVALFEQSETAEKSCFFCLSYSIVQ